MWLLEDAATALEDLTLCRLQISYESVGAGQVMARNTYSFRNDSALAGRPRAHRVVPMLPVSRRAAGDTRIINPNGRELVALDATFSRLALREVCRRSGLRAVGALAQLDQSRLCHLGNVRQAIELARDAHSRIAFESINQMGRRAVREDVQQLVDDLCNLLDLLTDEVTELNSVEEDSHSRSLRSARDAVIQMIQLVNARAVKYVPFVVLDESLEPSSTKLKTPPEYTLTVQQVERVAQPEYEYDPPSRIAVLHYGVRVLRWLHEPLTGASATRLGFPISDLMRTESTHYIIRSAKGVTFGPRADFFEPRIGPRRPWFAPVEAVNVDASMLSDSEAAEDIAVAPKFIHIHRRANHLERIVKNIDIRHGRHTRSSFSALSKKPAYHLLGQVILRIRYKEPLGLLLLFYSAVAGATAYATLGPMAAVSADSNPVTGVADLPAVVVAAIVGLAAHSFDRPMSERLLSRRIMLILLPFIIVIMRQATGF